MKYSIGDLVDLLSIIQRKNIHLKEHNFDEQYQTILKSIKKEGYNSKLIEQVCYLANANADTWHLESEIRKGNNMPLEEIGRRTLLIRESNKRRIEAKNEINYITKSGYQEKKVAHGSE